MENVAIKEKLKEYINTGDEKLLKLMYAVAKEYTETADEYDVSDEQLQEISKRRDMRVNGISKGYSWSEARKVIAGQKRLDEL